MQPSDKNWLDALSRRLRAIKARDIMTKKVITIKADAHLAEASHLMIEKRISGLPVKNRKGSITGVVTATDLFAVMDMIKSGDVVEGDTCAVPDPTVRFAMSSAFIKIRKSTSLEEIISIMKYKNVHTLPVFEGKKMVGVIGRRDVFKNFYNAVKDLL
jgi:CBS-domain-containing membrane protein